MSDPKHITDDFIAANHWRELQSYIRDCDGGACDTAQEAIDLFKGLLHAFMDTFDTTEMRVYLFACGGEKHIIAARGIAEACAIFWRNCDEYDPGASGEHRGDLPAIRPILAPRCAR